MTHEHSKPSEDGAAPASGERNDEASTTGLKLVTIAPGSAALLADGTPTLTRLETEEPPEVPPPLAAVDPYLGCTIDNRYKVEKLLGEGGMGVVYQCRHKIIDKKVAMKILRADMARDKEVTERFLIEAKAASSIGSEHIIDISDFGQLPDGSAYFVMEFLDGKPLSAEVGTGSALSTNRIARIGVQLAAGLAAAHDEGIVHRDLKPDNIYLIRRGAEDDFVKILDFGIAKVTGGAAQGKLTQAGSVFGTPHYMSPEQAAGAPVDHRGDIYSFGVILYELASGRVPFDADNFMGILTQHMYKAPVPIRALVPPPPNCPPGLEAIVLKCLSKRPEQRYQSMRELGADLGRLADGNVPNAVGEMMQRSGGFNVPADYFKKAHMPAPVPASPAGGHSPARWPLFAGIGAAVAIVAGIFFASSAGTSAAPEASPSAKSAAVPAPSEPAEAAADDEFVITTQVVLGIDPLEAHAFQGDRDLGRSPVVVQVPENETLTLVIRHKGHVDKTLVLDGSEERVSIKLEPAAKEARPRPQAVRRAHSRVTPPKPAPTPRKKKLGGGEIINPWAQ